MKAPDYIRRGRSCVIVIVMGNAMAVGQEVQAEPAEGLVVVSERISPGVGGKYRDQVSSPELPFASTMIFVHG